MDKRATGIIAYCTVIGLIVALIAGDREGAKFHINQALVIFIFRFLVLVPVVGWAWGIFMLTCWVLGLVAAINEEEKEVPLIGGLRIIK